MLKKTLTKSVYDCSAKDLLNIVADVRSYKDYIPFCSEVDIFDRSSSKESEHFSANLLINFRFTTENFLTRVSVNRKKNNISIIGNTKPFKSLNAEWSFTEKNNFCVVNFSLEVSFSSFIKERLVSISFEKVATNIIDAFEKKAKERNL